MSNKKPKDIEQEQHLAEVDRETRAIILGDLPREERLRITERLVEAAMADGLLDPYQVKEYIGVDSVGIKSIRFAIDNVKEKWLKEVEDGYQYASEQRATQINKAWQEVRECEKLYEDAVGTDSKVKVKKLQLEWLQYISKLSFVDKLVESQTPDMSIIVNGGMTVEAADDES